MSSTAAAGLVGLAHHLDRVAQLGPHAGPEDRMVLDEEDPGPPARRARHLGHVT